MSLLGLELSRVDLEKYVVRVRAEIGLITIRWRWDERGERQSKFDEVVRVLAGMAFNGTKIIVKYSRPPFYFPRWLVFVI